MLTELHWAKERLAQSEARCDAAARCANEHFKMSFERILKYSPVPAIVNCQLIEFVEHGFKLHSLAQPFTQGSICACDEDGHMFHRPEGS